MKYSLTILLLFATAVVSLASTGDSLWRLHDGVKSVLGTEALDRTNTLQAVMVVTADQDFVKKLYSPPKTDPQFTTIDRLKIGEQADVHVLFTNPKVDEIGSANVTCDIKVTRPNHQVTVNNGLEGFTGKLSGSRDGYYLSKSSLRISIEPTAPIGEWIIDVTLHDNNSHEAILLTTKLIVEQ